MILLKNPGDGMSYRVYVDDINVDIQSATFTATGLTFGSISVDNTTVPRSVVVTVTGGQHGQIYQGLGTFDLVQGGPLVRPIVIRVFNS